MYRRTVKKILFGWIFLLVIVALLGRVSVAAPDGGRTAADFLHIGLGARAAGMGGAYSAVSSGVASAYWNPAGLPELRGGEALLGHFSWYQDTRLEHGAVAYQLNPKTTMAASLNYLGYGSIEGRDANGQTTGDLVAYDWCGSLSLGRAISPDIAAGLTAKYITQRLDDISGSTFALDLGAKYYHEQFTVAAVIANVGPDMKFDDVAERIPSSARIGFAIRPFTEWFLTSVELEKRFYSGTVLRHGVEFTYQGQYFVRSGYDYYPQQEDRAFGSGLAFGVGMRLNQISFDYAYTPGEHYSSEDLHRFSLVFRFGQQ